MNTTDTTGKLFVISAPSGTGKSTIINELMKCDDLQLEFSISATTRKPREGEKDGVNYYFLSLDDFRQRIERGEFAEFEEVSPERMAQFDFNYDGKVNIADATMLQRYLAEMNLSQGTVTVNYYINDGAGTLIDSVTFKDRVGDEGEALVACYRQH